MRGHQKTLPIAELVPKNDQVLKEIHAEPHSTPPALLKFAQDMTPHLNLALESEEQAEAFFKEIAHLLTHDESKLNSAIGSFCLDLLEIVSRKYASCHQELEELLPQVSSKIRDSFLSTRYIY